MPPQPESQHVPVLFEETLRLLAPQPGEIWVDCTLGGAGHAAGIVERLGTSGRLIGCDQDSTMLGRAKQRLLGFPVTYVHANFEQLGDVLANLGLPTVDGILADLGFASDQMDDPQRGLSFREDGPLDMRLDLANGQTAADLVNRLSEQALADIFYEYGEERKSRWVAKRIIERRKEKPFEKTSELAELVRRCVPRSGHIDPATRVFQALRIAVNDELGALDRLLASLPSCVRSGGRVGIISFHSLEDRRVKLAFQRETWTPKTKKPATASDAEIQRNPRSRSAKLRVAKRV
ncbi:MAG: 16S rRNA (cytosine(1402)-N(4))-methyltransferase RsmH [Bacteroidales bacterium]|nr:16S rRNA (cytosine(1402)-N(4))-methyltransferase RsmH [Bacteroidales bacterium]